jgi:C-terminal processing protease CtpA/Prc
MSEREISGTTDWTEYKISLPMTPEATTQIVVGGLLSGKGKVWFDDLKIIISGKDISKAKILQKKHYPAEKDTTFNNGSNIVFPKLDNKAIDNLDLLGKVWGFLKYHHPEIGKGNYNWDYELFRILPEYLKVTDNKQRDQLLLDWINKYGEIPICTTCKETQKNAFLKPDFSWLKKNDASKALKNKIMEIYRNRHQGNHYYIMMAPFIGNPQFLNESSYSNMPYPDDGFRLLALYRYWNMIQYFFPSKYMTDKNWNNVLREYIPKFIKARNELEYELSALQLIGDINDTHAIFHGDQVVKFRGNNYAPFRVQFVENKLVVTDYYNPELQPEAKLQIGDIITHIAGKPVEKIVDSLKIYYPASNNTAKLRDMASDLLRSNDKHVDIQYITNNQTNSITLTLYPHDSLDIYRWYREDNEKCYKLLDGNIGYITLKSIKNEDIPVIKETFKNTKGIIIDIRNYPSVFVPFILGKYFCKKKMPFVKFSKGNVNNPGEFIFTAPFIIPASTEYYKGKLIILVNEYTQSQAEYTAMAFRAAPNTTIVGSTTAGADGNVSTIWLPGTLETWISGLGVYYPNGKETQRVGIIPDIKVIPTSEGIKAGRDEVLEKAIEIINKLK